MGAMRGLFVSIAMVLASPTFADPMGEAERLVALAAIPGAVVGVADAEMREVGFAGVRTAGGAAVEAGDPWHFGSITKSMPATLAGRMVEAGLLRWGGTLGEVLETPSADWADVTLEEALRHAAGFTPNLSWVAQGTTRADYVARVLRTSPEGPRGGFLYSNAGYVVAAAMLEAAGDAPWEDLIAREVFAPVDFEFTHSALDAGHLAGTHRQPAQAASEKNGSQSWVRRHLAAEADFDASVAGLTDHR